MTRLGSLLCKQGLFLLKNDHYALLCIAILALIPFTVWLSVAIILLITLRKGWAGGIKGLIVGAGTLLSISLMSMSLPGALITTAITFLPCYLTAIVLRVTRSWHLAGGFLVLQALLGIVLVHWFAPEFIKAQYQTIHMILSGWQEAGPAVDLFNDKSAANKTVLANYLVGVQAVSAMLSAIIPLMLARSVQAGLFYPGGFKQEMLAFRASGWGVVLLALAILGTYQHNPLAISCIPVLVLYYMSAGISLSFGILARGKKSKGLGVLVLLIILLILLPFVILPVYVIFGALDSLINFRGYLSVNKSGK